ncbi:tachykinin-like peptides receptor 86C, partial [Sitodiplosis mosellana]|uniref:tachykinin-like peptides receptor 86C n=1 Tax=Sitodiplosis mosellana TaxID=263140 RepID=UPI002443BC08
MDSHAVVNCMLLALKTYPFKIYINDSSGVSAFNPIAELNLTSGPTILTAEYSVYGNAPTSASARDFITDCFKPSPRRPYEIPWEQKAMWAFLFGSMLLIAIIGNCIVIWIVL